MLNLELYWAFLKIGGLTFGGGLTMLPMLKYELVERKQWIEEDCNPWDGYSIPCDYYHHSSMFAQFYGLYGCTACIKWY